MPTGEVRHDDSGHVRGLLGEGLGLQQQLPEAQISDQPDVDESRQCLHAGGGKCENQQEVHSASQPHDPADAGPQASEGVGSASNLPLHRGQLLHDFRGPARD